MMLERGTPVVLLSCGKCADSCSECGKGRCGR